MKRPITIQDVPEDIRQQIILDYLDTQNTSSIVTTYLTLAEARNR